KVFDTCIEKVHGSSASPLPPHLLAQILAKTAMGYIPRQGAMTRMRVTRMRMTMTRMTMTRMTTTRMTTTRMTTTSMTMKLKRMSNLCPLHVAKLSECVDPVCTISLSGDAFEESATLAETSSRWFSCAMTSQAL
ncbi:MAG: hypothetical protein ACRCZ9_09380, partial [Fusobacteriaceae bacterium]